MMRRRNRAVGRSSALVAVLVALVGVLALSPARAGAQTRSGNAPAATNAGIPERPEQLRFHDVPFEPPAAAPLRWELSNGIPVYVAEDRAVPLVSVSLALPVGDHDDPPDRVGLASLTAAMLRRGGAGERDAEAFDEAADALGIELDSLAGASRSGVWLEGSPPVLEEALDLMRDLVLAPRFEASRVALALDNLRGSLASRDDDPLSVLDREWRALLWGRTDPRARTVEPRHLDAIDPQAMADFHRRHWVARGAVFAVAGDVDARSVVAALERRFGSWQPGARDPGRPIVAGEGEAGSPPPATELDDGGVWTVRHRGPQGKLMIGHQGYQRPSWDDPDSWALMVMAELFGGPGPVSRLRSRLRAEEAMVYRVQASYGIGTETPGSFEVFVEVAPQGAVAAAGAVVAEIERLRDEPVAAVELQLAQRSLIDAFPLLFESAESVAGRYAEDALLDRPHRYWTLYRSRIAGVSAADLRRVARRHLDPERLRLLWVGPPLPASGWSVLGLGPAAEVERGARVGAAAGPGTPAVSPANPAR